MPGLPDSGGEFFVYSKSRPAGAAGLRIEGASQRTFSAAAGVTITGTSAAPFVRYTLITPGAVIDQGQVAVNAGRFTYTFDPAAVHAKVPLYDIVSVTTGRPQIGRVIHLTFFSEEKAGAAAFFDVARVILRGTTAITARGSIPAAAGTAAAGASLRRAVVEIAATAAGTASSAPAAAPTGSWPGSSAAGQDGGGGSARLADLRAADAEIDRLLRRGDLVLLSRQADPLIDGRTHERLQQLHEGIPVIGGQVTRQLEDGVTRSVFATLYAGIAADPLPRVAPEAALAVVEQALRSAGEAQGHASAAALPGAPQLVILPTGQAGYATAWRVDAPAANGLRHVFFVGAMDGQVLQDYSTRRRATVALADLAGGGESEAVRALAEEFAREETPAGQRQREFQQAMSRAFFSLVPSGASLALAREACRQSAVDLYPGGSAAAREVEAFWRDRLPE
jgi:hypothetical protein